MGAGVTAGASGSLRFCGCWRDMQIELKKIVRLRVNGMKDAPPQVVGAHAPLAQLQGLLGRPGRRTPRTDSQAHCLAGPAQRCA